jgi:hypothetical protein
MRIPTDEQLCEMSQEELKNLKFETVKQRVLAAKENRYHLHQRLGGLLCKLDQLINQ